MKKLLFFAGFLLTFSSFLLFPASISAHFPVDNGEFELEFHVTPDDAPVSGSESALFFTLNKQPTGFMWEHCDCTLTIYREGIMYHTEQLASMQSTYTFPDPGIYSLEISGKPKTEGMFEPFTVTYDYRVTQGPAMPTGIVEIITIMPQAGIVTGFSPTQGFLIQLTGVVLIIVSVCAVLYLLKNKKTRHVAVVIFILLSLQLFFLHYYRMNQTGSFASHTIHEHPEDSGHQVSHDCCIRLVFFHDTYFPGFYFENEVIPLAEKEEIVISFHPFYSPPIRSPPTV